jgi:RNA polymerase sigma-70 factor (ECF subfamily)
VVASTTVVNSLDVVSMLTDGDLGAALDQHRVELTAHCYRMLGSGLEADDAVQETLVRAWRSYDRFEGRSSLRTWLYRIATNVCLSMMKGPQRRARPMDLGPSTPIGDAVLGPPHPEAAWLQPVPDGQVMPSDADPAEVAATRETIRLAFVAALQHLPPRQRAVLVLREVLHWSAADVADLLGSTVVSVNSALQRARATLADRGVAVSDPPAPLGPAERELADRFADAFERYDMDELVTLLRDDAVMSMPPFALWLRGPDDIVGWMTGPGAGCAGSRLIPAPANGLPAWGQYKPDGQGFSPWALAVVEADPAGDRIAGLNFFLDTETLFPQFGLPHRLDPS